MISVESGGIIPVFNTYTAFHFSYICKLSKPCPPQNMKKYGALTLFLSLCLRVFGQSGPGGVGNEDGTAGQPQNIIWLRAGAGITASGGLVNSWTDQSGNFNNATGVSTTRPTLITSDANFNGKASINFPTGATTHQLVIADADKLDNTSGLTVFYVIRPSATITGNIIAKRTGVSAEQAYVFSIRQASPRFITQLGTTTAFTSGTYAANTTYIHSDVVNGTSATSFLGGASAGSGGSPSPIPSTASDVYIGADPAVDNFEGNIAEVIVYSAALNTAQRQIVENHLAAYYTTTNLGTGDVYAGDTPANGDHDFQVIGIGIQSTGSHSEAAGGGLALTPANATLNVNGEFLLAGHDGLVNGSSVSNLGTGVQARWNRTWYINKTTAGTLDANIAFDFGDGLGGNFPQNKDNYVLLRLTAGLYEIVAIANADKTLAGDRITFKVGNADLTNGTYTLGTINATTSPVSGVANKTWYSYQSGDWNDSGVWTLDGGVFPLYVNPSNQIPSPSDNVIIHPGRIITANISNIQVGNVQVDGTLDFGATTGHNFLTIAGIGRIRLGGAIDNFPSGDASLFADNTIGGTVEIYGAGMSISTSRTFNNLEINMNTGLSMATLLANVTLNGHLNILNGILRFNDNSSTTSKTFTVTGDVSVEASAGIAVGTGNARHEFNLNGDFITDGTCSFTNRVAPNYTAEASDGIVDVNFVNDYADQTVSLNGPTTFYRIEINKGVDYTYKVTLTASAPAYFNLLGYANDGHGSQAQLTANDNALGLLYGTVEIGTNIIVSNLSNTGNYNVSAGAQLWVNGGTVNKNNGQALVPYGKIRLTLGLLTANVNSGITTRDNGTIVIEGGTLTANQIRTSVFGVGNVGGYTQTGGNVTVDGDAPGSSAAEYYVFSLTYTGNTFFMSGGTLTVKGARGGTGGLRGAFLINCDPANVNVTGGTIIFEIDNDNVYKVTSRVPLYDVIMRKTAGTGTIVELNGGTGDNLGTTIAQQPLTILNDLTVEAGVNFLTNNADVTIGGSFEVQNTALYTPGNNTTTFNKSDIATITFGNTSATQMLNNLTINKANNNDKLRVAGGAATAVQINGTLTVQQGDFDPGSFIISARGPVVVSDTIGSIFSTGRLLLDGTGAQVLTSSSARIKHLEIDNTNGVTLTGALSIYGTLTLTNGVFNINSYRLTMSGALAAIAGSGFGTTKMIQTAGNASDGGLEMYFNANESMLYPMGTNASSTVRYTPATIQTQSLFDDGYVTVGIEDNVLQTINLGGSADRLSYNWRISHQGFSTLPLVSHQFTYADSDITGTESNYVPGKVLGLSPFTRSSEDATDIDVGTNLLTFNGATTGSVFPGAGFTLVQANYTAAGVDCFTGSPEVFYTRSFNGGWEQDWRNINMWTLAPNDIDGNGQVDSYEVHDSRQPVASDYPQAGDVAVVGWVPWADPAGNNGRPHGIAMNQTETVAELRFTKMLSALNAPVARVYAFNFQFRPTVVLNHTGTQGQLSSGIVSGEGAFWIRSTGGNLSDPAFANVDLGNFNGQDSSYFIYENTLASGTYVNVPSSFPNLMMTTDGWGAEDKNSTIDKDVTVNGNLELLGDVNLVLATGATGNITVNRNLKFYRSDANGNDSGGGGEIRFGNTGMARTISVLGDLKFGNGYEALINVNTPGTTPIAHTFNLHGNFYQQTVAGFGFKGGTSAANDHINLNLLGSASSVIVNGGGDDPQFYAVTVNKGSSIATTVTSTTNFSLNAPTNMTAKALTLTNGLLVLNNIAVNINLSTGGGDFRIPSSAGLEVRGGTVNVSGADTGILLDGLLRVSGGTVNMDGGVGFNNYIEYSASGMAELEVAGGTLIVGSQIRRNLTSTTGVLRYTQTAGTVTVGRRTAPNPTRGVFEVLNTGSLFSHTGGSFTIVQGVNSTTVPSLWLEPEISSVTSGSTIVIGDANTPAGVNSQNIGIKSSIPLYHVTIEGANSPIAKLYILPLTLQGNLLISNATSGATLNALSQPLNIGGSMTVNGTFTPSSNTTTFTGSGTISGTTAALSFYNLSKSGSGTVIQAKNITVEKDFSLLGGTYSASSFATLLKGNATVDGTFTNTGGVGLSFVGTTTQQLLERSAAGTGNLGMVTLDNIFGVRIPDASGFNFNINSGLRMVRGVLDISSSLLTLSSSAEITPVNAFGVTNMIQTNSSFTDNGVRKFFPAGHTLDFTFPVGQSLYTPVIFNFSAGGHTTGTGTPSILVRPANEIHPSVIEDSETPNPEIVDIDNVLKYHWILNADNVSSGFNSEMTLMYDQSLVGVTAPYTEANYISARILSDANPSNNVEKFSNAEVNETTNVISFTFSGVTDAGISGEYFAGIDDAIPNNIRTFTTVRSGNVTEGSVSGVYDQAVPGGGVPNGSSLVVESGHTLTFNVSGVNLYKTEIKLGGILEVPAGSLDHRLGVITGEGTLRVVSNTTSAVLPAAYYNDFFACYGGNLNYGGTGNYEIMGSITVVRNLILDGAGAKVLANNDINVCEDMTVTSSAFRNDINNRNISIGDDLIINSTTATGYRVGTGTINIGGDILQSGGSFLGSTSTKVSIGNDLLVSGGTFSPGSNGFVNIGRHLTYSGGTFSGGAGSLRYTFNGTTPQIITGDFSVAPAIFNYFEINNTAGLTLAGGNTSISGRLYLTNGNIFPGTTTFTLLNNAAVLPSVGKSNSFVSGRLYKVLAAGGSFTFPIGKSTLWRTGSINNTSDARTWDMEYFIGNASVEEPLVDNMTPTVTAPPILRISLGEYWKVSDDVSPTTGRVGLSWGVESDVSLNLSERAALKVMVWNDATSSWDSYGGGTFSAGHTQARGTFVAATATSFSQHIVTLGSTEVANPLPVEFLSFEGRNLDAYNQLTWATASEHNNHQFVLEHSVNGELFTPIATVDAKGSPGEGKKYRYVHEEPSIGRNYYRLKQVDLDGTWKYHPTVVKLEVSIEDFGLDFTMSPNPTGKGSVTLHIAKANEKSVHVRVFDVSGNLMIEKDISAGRYFSDVELPLSLSMVQGIYLVELSQGYYRKVRRLMVK
jgi:hypothetical protein